jgi:hypothetical protein
MTLNLNKSITNDFFPALSFGQFQLSDQMHRMSSCSAAVTFGRPALMCLEAVKPESIEQKSKYHDIIISLMTLMTLMTLLTLIMMKLSTSTRQKTEMTALTSHCSVSKP